MTEAEALRGLPKGSKGVDLREKETAFATADHPFAKEGDAITAHPLLLKDFEKRGFITRQKVKKTA